MDVEMKNPQYGTDTLEVISVARNFNRWMYDTVKPFCSGKILEIGRRHWKYLGLFSGRQSAHHPQRYG